MILDYLLHKAEKISVPLTVKKSSCSRFRLAESKCGDCINACPFNAISIEDEIQINEKKCEGCLLCTAACKNEAISAEISVNTFEKLKVQHQKILIGCTKADNVHHFRKACIGWLSEEVLLYLAKNFPNGFAIDKTNCAKCVNKPALDFVEKNICSLNSKYPYLNFYTIDRKENLDNFSKVFSRRDFFTILSVGAKKEAVNYSDSQKDVRVYYSDTNLSLKRNAVMALAGDENSNEYLDFVYDININDSCTNCMECTAICPTSSLIENDLGKLEVKAERCSGCNLCSQFCLDNAIVVLRKNEFVMDIEAV
ncbi:MAG: 4Fe-4S binding protein [Bacteroidetes bacterium]|nr:4Fe-4S binding protein [Bacteroidota bacterium]